MKYKFLILVIVMIPLLSACSQNDSGTAPPTPTDNIESEENTVNSDHWDYGMGLEDLDDSKEIDLTTMSSTMVYSHIYNMTISPEDYLGKTITMTGEFVVYKDLESGVVYTACLITDALACCVQGLEFTVAEELVYPGDYPEENSSITVKGTFELYEEDGASYMRLGEASII